MAELIECGWSKEKLGTPVAIEMPPHFWQRQVALNFNKALHQSSEGKLAPPMEDKIEYLALGTNHTTQACRCFVHQTRHDHEGFTFDGVVSKEIAFELAPSLQAPCEQGFSWLVIKKEIEIAVPGISEFISDSKGFRHIRRPPSQVLGWGSVKGGKPSVTPGSPAWGLADSLNIGQNAFKPQSVVETMLLCYKLAKSNLSTYKDARWSTICSALKRQRSHLAGIMQPLVEFVRLYSGGLEEGPQYLIELCHFVQSINKPREIGASTLVALNSSNIPPQWAIACLKATLSAPADYCKDGSGAPAGGNAQMAGRGPSGPEGFLRA